MKLEDLKLKYDKLQRKYGAKELDSIYNGECTKNPDLGIYLFIGKVMNIMSITGLNK